MTRWAMVADLRRCVGCQTCTAACKHTNATAPGVQWRRVLDIEAGEYPNVTRTFVPVGCMHCDDPPCMHVCPSTATGKRDDGVVTIDYDLCIGCAYCAVACPYQARYKVQRPSFAYGGRQMPNEAEREDPRRLGVAQKCTFCADRIDFGLANGLTPGVDPAATPACVNSCIAGALHFGDADDPDSNVSKLLNDNAHFLMHEELGTGPGIHYLWDGKDGKDDAGDDAPISGGTVMTGVSPWRQSNWDWRAAANFILGGSGGGLYVVAALAALSTGFWAPYLTLAGVVMVMIGLGFVWLEIGRPWRAFNVFFNPGTSWMTREAMAATAFVPVAMISVIWPAVLVLLIGPLLAVVFVYCQGRILRASKGIPAWREDAIVALIVATGLAEGTGLFAAALPLFGDGGMIVLMRMLAATVLGIALVARAGFWMLYLSRLRKNAPAKALAALDRSNGWVLVAGHVLPIVLAILALLLPSQSGLLLAAAGLAALVSGWGIKASIVITASYNQGYAIRRAPARGGSAGAGAKPGWTVTDAYKQSAGPARQGHGTLLRQGNP